MLTMVPAHWSVEWVRPVTPNFRLFGPLLPRPGRPLPDERDVNTEARFLWRHGKPSCSEVSSSIALARFQTPLLVVVRA